MWSVRMVERVSLAGRKSGGAREWRSARMVEPKSFWSARVAERKSCRAHELQKRNSGEEQ